MKIKQYKYEKKEIASKEIDLPTETSYYFETSIRRSIKIIPHFTSWNKKQYNKEEELYELEIICLYNSFECKAEKYNKFIIALVENWFQKRTKEQFEADFNHTFSEMQ
jgi:sulfatase maturation enzyme AslB (radical SAM superfamily)